MVAELDNKRLHGELLMLRTDMDAAKAELDSATAGALRYEQEMLKEQKQVAAYMAELEKLKKKLVRVDNPKSTWAVTHGTAASPGACHMCPCCSALQRTCRGAAMRPWAVVTCFANVACTGRRGGQS